MYEVLYYSMGGKTKKIAEVIAAELGVIPENIEDKPNIDTKSFVFIGSGCYGGKPMKDVCDFISSNDFSGRSVAIFGTSASRTGGQIQTMENMLLKKGANVAGCFACRGNLLLLNIGHPNETDYASARAFARTMMQI